MRFNFELAQKLITRFRRMRHKEHFTMYNVAERTECGTAMCIAGHILNLTGHKVKFTEDGYAAWVDSKKLPVEDPLGRAAELLGVTRVEATASETALFFRFELTSPREAAEAIKSLVKEKEQYEYNV